MIVNENNNEYGVMEKEIYLAELEELINEERPTDEQRRRDLEESIGTFEEALIEALCG